MTPSDLDTLKMVRDAVYWADWLFKLPELQNIMEGKWGDPEVVARDIAAALPKIDALIAHLSSEKLVSERSEQARLDKAEQPEKAPSCAKCGRPCTKLIGEYIFDTHTKKEVSYYCFACEELLHPACKAFEVQQPPDWPYSEDGIQAVIDAVRPYLRQPAAPQVDENRLAHGVNAMNDYFDGEDVEFGDDPVIDRAALSAAITAMGFNAAGEKELVG